MCTGSSALVGFLIKSSLFCLHLGFHRDGMHGYSTPNYDLSCEKWDRKSADEKKNANPGKVRARED